MDYNKLDKKVTDLGVKEVPLEVIKKNPNQPRKIFDESKLKELADNIKNNGLLQPIVLRRISSEEYIIIAGERRYRAHLLLNLKSIQARVIECSDKTAYELSLLENIQREDITVLEEANAYKKLQDEYGYKLEDIKKVSGKSVSNISNILSILNEPEEIQKLASTGELSLALLVWIKQLPSTSEKLKAIDLLKKGKLSFRTIKEYVHKINKAYRVSQSINVLPSLLTSRELSSRASLCKPEDLKLPKDFNFFYVSLGKVEKLIIDLLPIPNLLVPAYGLMHDKSLIRTTLKYLIQDRRSFNLLMLDSGGLPAVDRKDFKFFDCQSELLKFYEGVEPDLCVMLDVPCYPKVLAKMGISKQEGINKTLDNAKHFLKWTPKFETTKLYVFQAKSEDDVYLNLEHFKKIGVFKDSNRIGFGFGGGARTDTNLLVRLGTIVVKEVKLLRKDVQVFHFFGIGNPSRIKRLYNIGFNSFDSTTPDRLTQVGLWIFPGYQMKRIFESRAPYITSLRRMFNWISYFYHLNAVFSD